MPREPLRTRVSRAIYTRSGKLLPVLHASRIKQAERQNAANVGLFRLPLEIRRQIMDYLFSDTIMLIADENDQRSDRRKGPELIRFHPRRVDWSLKEQLACLACPSLLASFEEVPGTLLPRRTCVRGPRLYPVLLQGVEQCPEHSSTKSPYSDEVHAHPLELQLLLVSRTCYLDARAALAAATYVLPATVHKRGWMFDHHYEPENWGKARLPAYVRKFVVEDMGLYVAGWDSKRDYLMTGPLQLAAYLDALRTWLRACAPGVERLELVESAAYIDGGQAYGSQVYQERFDAAMAGKEGRLYRYLDHVLDEYDAKLTLRVRMYPDCAGRNIVLGRGADRAGKPDVVPLDLEKLVLNFKVEDKIRKLGFARYMRTWRDSSEWLDPNAD